MAASLADAFQRAYAGDPISAYGGILAFNRPLDVETAMLITEPNRFIECIIAPHFSDKAFEMLTTRPSWKKNVRLLEAGSAPTPEIKTPGWDFRRIEGGLLVQTSDGRHDDWQAAKTVDTRRAAGSI